MEITEVRVKLMEDSDDRLQAFCSITFDNSFVVRDLKIIEGSNGAFVAMPSRKLTSHCRGCGAKNHLRAGYCNNCGARLREERASRDAEGRTKLYADIAHPINSQCREMIQDRVIAEYQAELDRAQQPGYVSRYDDDYDDDVDLDAIATPEVPPLPARTTIQQAETPQGPHLRQARPRAEADADDLSIASPAPGQGQAEQSQPPAERDEPSDPEGPKDSGFGAGIFD